MLNIRDFFGHSILCLVADGHGVEGDTVSEEVKLKFPNILETQILKEFGFKNKEEAEGQIPTMLNNTLKITDALKNAFVKVDS